MTQANIDKFIKATNLLAEAFIQYPDQFPILGKYPKFPLNLAEANQNELDAALDRILADLRTFLYFGGNYAYFS